MDFILEKGWGEVLNDEFNKPYVSELKNFLQNEIDAGKSIFPDKSLFFEALNRTPLEDVKVVILGQDPYHGEGQAHGLSFSVKKGVKVPPSLRNIYKELENDVGFVSPDYGDLESWAKQGVLLLNNTLSVEMGKAGSHQKKGWEKITNKVIEIINEKREGVVFILWGGPAQKKGAKVDESKHLVLKSPHPSPLSSYRGFFGCKHFSKTNNYLASIGKQEINWQIS